MTHQRLLGVESMFVIPLYFEYNILISNKFIIYFFTWQSRLRSNQFSKEVFTYLFLKLFLSTKLLIHLYVHFKWPV